jgi:hypothetical protein
MAILARLLALPSHFLRTTALITHETSGLKGLVTGARVNLALLLLLALQEPLAKSGSGNLMLNSGPREQGRFEGDFTRQTSQVKRQLELHLLRL